MTQTTVTSRFDPPDVGSSGGVVLFEERQRMRQPWVWITMAFVNVVVIALFAHGLYQQLYLGQPWGNNPASDRMLVVIAVCTIGLTLGVTLVLWFVELYVRVDDAYLTIRYRPLIHKRIRIGDIIAWQACRYHPIMEYGGWGIRYSLSFRGWAYTVSGNEGVRVHWMGGKERLIGSGRAAELADALAEAKAASRT